MSAVPYDLNTRVIAIYCNAVLNCTQQRLSLIALCHINRPYPSYTGSSLLSSPLKLLVIRLTVECCCSSSLLSVYPLQSGRAVHLEGQSVSKTSRLVDTALSAAFKQLGDETPNRRTLVRTLIEWNNFLPVWKFTGLCIW